MTNEVGPRASLLRDDEGQFDNHHLSFADFEEGYIRHYIALADTKAGWAFTVVAAILSYMFSSTDFRNGLSFVAYDLRFFLSWLSVVALLLSAYNLFRVIAPRLSSLSAEGITFFGAVSSFASAKSYAKKVSQQSLSRIAEARLGHCYDIARVCNSKYSGLRLGLWIGLFGLAFFLAALAVP